MPLTIPSLQTIHDRMIDDAVTRSGDPSLREPAHPANILLTSFSAPILGLYAQLQSVIDQSFVTTATGLSLDGLARVWSLTRVKAGKALDTLTVTGAPETRIPENTLFSLVTGARYRITDSVRQAATTIPTTGTLDIAIEAVEGGKQENAALGVAMTLVNPISGLASTATAKTAITGGSDEESDSALRARLLARIRNPARSGTSADYRLWALSRQRHDRAVTRAWITPRARGTGTVNILVMMDDSYDNGLPKAGDLTAITAYIDKVRPLGADIQVKAPTRQITNITIVSLSPDNQAVKDAIKENIAVLFRKSAKPGGTIALSQISEAISTATGEVSHILTTPTGNVTSTDSNLPVLGTVIFT